MMTRRGTKRPLVIKASPRMVSTTHIITNMRTAGMTRERYFGLLDEIG